MTQRQLALAGRAFLEAISALLEKGSGSRGSHLVLDPSGALPHPDLDDEWRFIPENIELRKIILGTAYADDAFTSIESEPRKLAEEECWFENTWAEYRQAEVFRNGEDDDPKPSEIYK